MEPAPEPLERRFRGRPVRRMHVMVKPAGPLCNLDCTYCHYLSKQELLGRPTEGRISDELLESFIRQYFEGQNHKEVVFSWQCGEPTLLGIDFFRKVVALEKKYCPPHVRCENDLKTNGTSERSAREGFPIFCAERLQAVKWRNWKLHFMRQDTMFDPPVKNPVPTIYNLYTDPREEKPTADTWVVGPMLKIVGAYEESVKRHPLIPMGTPDPYAPAK